MEEGKTSVARVYVKPGTGNITVNGKDAKTYFCTDMLVYKVNQPFLLTETVGQYDVTVNVSVVELQVKLKQLD